MKTKLWNNVGLRWAIVAALLDAKSSENMPGEKTLWYAPEVIQGILSSRVEHDIGSHGGRHRYFDDMSEQQCIEDLQFAAYIHKKNGLALNSFVYPRNKVSRTYLLAHHGIRIYRGQDIAWHETIRNRNVYLGRVANLIDKIMPQFF